MKTIVFFRSWLTRLQQAKWLNRYTVAFSIFFIWMIFFDKHNLIVQYRLSSSVIEMRRDIERFDERYIRAVEERAIMDAQKERYAREKYYMHRPDEDVFIVERD